MFSTLIIITGRRFNQRLIRQSSCLTFFILKLRFPVSSFQEFHFKTSERAMQHTFATSSSTLPCDDSVKVNLVDIILSNNIEHSWFFISLCSVHINQCFYTKSIWITLFWSVWNRNFLWTRIVLHFRVIVSWYKTYIIDRWETDFCWLQDLGKHATISAPKNRITDLKR